MRINRRKFRYFAPVKNSIATKADRGLSKIDIAIFIEFDPVKRQNKCFSSSVCKYIVRTSYLHVDCKSHLL